MSEDSKVQSCWCILREHNPEPFLNRGSTLSNVGGQEPCNPFYKGRRTSVRSSSRGSSSAPLPLPQIRPKYALQVFGPLTDGVQPLQHVGASQVLNPYEIVPSEEVIADQPVRLAEIHG